MSEENNTLLQIAKVLKSNGTDGGILLGFRDIAPEDIDLKEPVFIYFDGLPVPFFIDSFTRKGTNKAIAKLTDMSSLEDAEEIVGQAVYVDESTIEGYEDDDDFGFEDLEGWAFINNGSPAGTVSGFEDIPGNPCLYVTKDDGEEVMVPLHEDLLEAIDAENQEVRMNLPEGLL
ncbi:MAG: hypothetical protein MJY94_04660 [Bacteroidales bacterium]|nr:hypothetical protein [Bacteroidales bacterium]